MTEKTYLKCLHGGRCSGCPWIHLSYEEQLEKKTKDLMALLNEANLFVADPEIKSAGHAYLRTRMDLSFYRYEKGPHLGLYDQERKEIIDFKECHQMVPELWQAILRFKENLPPVELGNFRFRISPNGEIGVWMDLPNASIKYLLEEKNWLKQLSEWAKIELGQKRKALSEVNGELKIKDIELHPWFQTYLGEDLKAFSLYSTIGDFTQPGFKSNRLLLKSILDLLASIPASKAVELCSGIGNFSFFLSSLGWEVKAHELNPSSLKACEKTKEEFEKLAIAKGPDFFRSNIHAKNLSFMTDFEKAHLVVADPPRSGLQSFTQIFKEAQSKPEYFLYISCFAKTFVKDLIELKNIGYELKELVLIDQFTQGPHLEMLSLLEYRGKR